MPKLTENDSTFGVHGVRNLLPGPDLLRREDTRDVGVISTLRNLSEFWIHERYMFGGSYHHGDVGGLRDQQTTLTCTLVVVIHHLLIRDVFTTARTSQRSQDDFFTG
jgi:hypothetical protein